MTTVTPPRATFPLPLSTRSEFGNLSALRRVEDEYSQIVVAERESRKVRQITFDCWGKDAVWWSPDGTRVAYGGGASSDGALYVLNADGGGPFPVVPAGGRRHRWHIEVAAWSPSGRQLAYVGYRGNPEQCAGGCGPSQRDDHAPALYVLDLDTGRRQTIAANMERRDGRFEMVWVDPRFINVGDELIDVNTGVRTGIAHRCGGCRRLVFGNRSPYSWSPTGDEVAFSTFTRDHTHPLYVLTPSTGELRELASATSTKLKLLGYPSWSPDGQWIAFETGDSVDHVGPPRRLAEFGSLLTDDDVALIRPDGTDLHTVYTRWGDDDGLTWSPDSRTIAFQATVLSDDVFHTVLRGEPSTVNIRGLRLRTVFTELNSTDGHELRAWSFIPSR